MGQDWGYACQARIDREKWDAFGVSFDDLIGDHPKSVKFIHRKCGLYYDQSGEDKWDRAAGWEPISVKQIWTTQEEYPGSVCINWTDVE